MGPRRQSSTSGFSRRSSVRLHREIRTANLRDLPNLLT